MNKTTSTSTPVTAELLKSHAPKGVRLLSYNSGTFGGSLSGKTPATAELLSKNYYSVVKENQKKKQEHYNTAKEVFEKIESANNWKTQEEMDGIISDAERLYSSGVWGVEKNEYDELINRLKQRKEAYGKFGSAAQYQTAVENNNVESGEENELQQYVPMAQRLFNVNEKTPEDELLSAIYESKFIDEYLSKGDFTTVIGNINKALKTNSKEFHASQSTLLNEDGTDKDSDSTNNSGKWDTDYMLVNRYTPDNDGLKATYGVMQNMTDEELRHRNDSANTPRTRLTTEMTQTERDVYNYIRFTEGPSKASKFLDDYVLPRITGVIKKEIQDEAKQLALENPVAAWIYSTANKALLEPLVNGLNTVYYAVDPEGYVKYQPANEQLLTQTNTIRQTQSEALGDVGGLVYNVGTGMVDLFAKSKIAKVYSTYLGAIGLFDKVAGSKGTTKLANKGGSTYYLSDATANRVAGWLMKASSASDIMGSTIADATSRGLSYTEALSEALSMASIEALVEGIGVDNLLRSDGSAIKAFLSEGLEEGLSAVAEPVVDAFIAGDKSNWQASINAYMQEGKSKKEATILAIRDIAGDVVYEAGFGAAIGGTMKAATNLAYRKSVPKSTVTISSDLQKTKNKALDSIDKQGDITVTRNGVGEIQINQQEQIKAVESSVTGQEAAAVASVHKVVQSGEVVDLSKKSNKEIYNAMNASDGDVVMSLVLKMGGVKSLPHSVHVRLSPNGEGGGYVVSGLLLDGDVFIDFTNGSRESVFNRGTTEVSGTPNPEAPVEQKTEKGSVEFSENRTLAPNIVEDPTLTKEQRAEKIESDLRASAQEHGIAEDVTNAIAFIAKKSGTHVLFVDQVYTENGTPTNGRFFPSKNAVLISKNAEAPVYEVVKHELTHSIRGTKQYDALVEFVKNSQEVKSVLESNGLRFEGLVQSKINQYADAGVRLKYDDAVEEIVASYVSKYLLTDQQHISELFKSRQNVFYKFLYNIRNWMKNIRTPKDVKMLQKAERLYVNALSQKGKRYYKSTFDGEVKTDGAVDDGSYSIDSNEDFSTEMQNLVEKYGAIKKGFNAERDIAIPKSVDGETKVARAARTMAESKEAIPDWYLPEYESDVVLGAFSYKPKTNKGEQQFANQKIDELGFDGALDYWRNPPREADGGDVLALGAALLKEAAKNKDVPAIRELSTGMALALTDAGQMIQAAKLLKNATPEGQALILERIVRRMNNENAKKKRLKSTNKKADAVRERIAEAEKRGDDPSVIDALYKELNDIDGTIHLSDSAIKNIASQTTPEGLEAAVDSAMQEIADQKPATWADKWNQWRFISMLANIKTHIKNFFSTVAFAPVVQTKNIVKFAMESMFSKKLDHRESSIGNHFVIQKKYRDFVEKNYQKNKQALTSTGKYNSAYDNIRSKMAVYKTKWLESLRKKNSALLEAEDAFSLKFHYKRALAQYLSGNKIDPNNVDPETLAKAEMYAAKESLKATFRDESALAAALQKFADKNNFTKMVVEGIIPFKKTPINVTKRAFEYSPASIISGAIDAAQLKLYDNANTNANDIIDKMASGLTGSMLMGLGAILRHFGVLTGFMSEDKEEKEFDKLQGEQGFAINIGDYSFTIDWLAPSSLPLFVGVQLYDEFANEDGASIGEVLEAISALTDPVVELSMLQGIQQMIESASYDNGIASMVTNAGLSYLSQGVPTLLGQTARVLDDTRRQSYVESGAPLSGLQYSYQQALGKIPFLESGKKEYVNQWGETEVTSSVVERIFANMISPSYYKKKRDDKLNTELERLYNSTKENGVLPSTGAKRFTQNSKEYILSANESTAYEKKLGKTSYEMLKKLTSSSAYKKMDDTQRVYAVKKIYEYAADYAKKEVVTSRGEKYELSSATQKINEVITQDLNVSDYLLFAYIESTTSADKYEYGKNKGKTISGTKKKNIQKAAKDAGFSYAEIRKYMRFLGYKM